MERGNLRLRCKRKSHKWKNHEGESTDAEFRGGLPCSSDGSGVMCVERRGQVIRVPIMLVNWQQEEPADRGEERQLFMDDTSRVSREAQARFREGLGVQFPGATRPTT